MRRPHFLTHNKGAEYPRQVVWMDTETSEKKLDQGEVAHVLAFGWAKYQRRVRGHRWEAEDWKRFTTRAEFWSWALRKVRKKGKLVIYCHNAEFDAKVVDAFGELRRRRWRLVTACLEGPPTIITWRRGKRTVQWLDTLNIWPVPLAELGRRLGHRKLPRPRRWTGSAKDDTYCTRDVTIIERTLKDWWTFLRDHDLGNAMPTIAGQAFSSFRHRFMRHPIFIDDNPDALQLARDAYLGGRCECFRLGVMSERGVTLDVNSMYPYVMRELLAPAKLLTVRTAATLADLERYVREYACVAEVELETEEPAFPHVVDGRLCFPVGRFTQALATPELAHALSLGSVKRLRRVAVYERAPLFRSFVDWAWRERLRSRERGASTQDWHIKRLVNAFYGKWGQRAKTWDVVGVADDVKVESVVSWDVDRREWRHIRQLGREYQELIDKGEAMNSHPAIAAHVTSAARLYLWQLIVEAGRNDVWYCDTDSLKGAAVIAKRLSHRIGAERLGALKIEERHAWVDIRGAKDYTTPEHERMKGVRSSAQSNDFVAYLQTRWEGWAGAIARGRLDMPVTRDDVKVLGREYLKGTPLPDGHVEPLRLPRSDAAGRDGGR